MDSKPRGRTTERSLYPILIDVIREQGGAGVSETNYDTEPDIVFDLENRKWILGVKIGESPEVIVRAFAEYQRHKRDSRIEDGLLIFIAESIRKVRPEAAVLRKFIDKKQVRCLVSTPLINDHWADLTFAGVVDRLASEVIPALRRHEVRSYPLDITTDFLREQVVQLMEEIPPEDPAIIQAITDKNLLTGIGNLDRKHAGIASQFLGACILVSQLLFLRLYGVAHPGILPPAPVDRTKLRKAFKKILEIDYRPVFEIDVLDSIPEDYLTKTYDLITGLAVEQVRYELPGRLFHALMPQRIRKLMAAFYTRPQAAYLLSCLTINRQDATVLDPACGSGTILVSAYRRKKELLDNENKGENPHSRFCEQEIFGCDIMPFAVHLTTANLAAMDPATTIEQTKIFRGDSLLLIPGVRRKLSHMVLFPRAHKATSMTGEEYEVEMPRFSVVLMNPPFTKIEHGIREFVNMERFSDITGNEVGLWGHFMALAYEMLEENGVMGAVIPIQFLRGRESERIRRYIFERMVPLYVVKPVLNYAFSESARFRDILLIARKSKPDPGNEVRFCLLKKNLTGMNPEMARDIAKRITGEKEFQSAELDIESHTMDEISRHIENLMPYVGVTDFEHRKILANTAQMFGDKLARFPKDHFREGFRFERELSSVLCFTRALAQSRLREAFLRFDSETPDHITARDSFGVEYEIEKSCLTPFLRTSTGLNTMNITGRWDYLAHKSYDSFERVLRAAGTEYPPWAPTFRSVARRIQKANLVVARRVNPHTADVHFLAFFAEEGVAASDQFKLVDEQDLVRAKALCVLFNSAIFLSHLYLFKEETTDGSIDIRGPDLDTVALYPNDSRARSLADVFGQFANQEFPALRYQLDQSFDKNYEAFWEKESWEKEPEIAPHPQRLALDAAVSSALGSSVSEDDLRSVYAVIAKEMVIRRGILNE